MQVRFTELAENDIIDNYLYGLTNFGQIQAEKYEADLRKTIKVIADNPQLANERPEYKPPVRIHHHNKHYIVYLIEDHYILIVRILRDEVDLERQL